VLSSGAMKQIFSSKLVTALLLTAFIVASVGTVFGYAWCIGDDGHVEVSYAKNIGCCVDELDSHTADRYDVPTISMPNGDSCGLCLDFSVQQYDAVFFKRIKKFSTLSVAALPSHILSAKAVQRDSLVAGNLASQPPPRVSQAILAHRTVVLLN
jgi:hypothetical protein